jgi:PIN domain nuclease of toxin-antitoxin system
MAIVLFLEKRKMPSNIKSYFEDASTGKVAIVIPAIAIAEIAYLSEKGRITTNLSILNQIISNSSNGFSVSMLDFETINTAFQIQDIPELHDRLIAATAVFLNLPLLTNDPIIEKSTYLTTFWK